MPPFGFDCEFKDFEACVQAQMNNGKTTDEAQAICGKLQQLTEEDCKRVQVMKEEEDREKEDPCPTPTD